MVSIAVIGTGELGSRHLQALTNMGESVRLYGIDPTPSSLELAKSRIGELEGTAGRSEVIFLQQVSELTEPLDLVVLATNANRRLDIVTALLEQATVQNIILEKVLFQNPDDYQQALNLVSAAKVRAWVNCPRRMMPLFQYIGDELANSGPLHYQVTGSNWGLGTNAIHHIDTLSMLTGQLDYTIDSSQLSSDIFPAKRDGFVEFSGALVGEFAGGHKFELECSRGDQLSQTTTIGNPDHNFAMTLTNGTLTTQVNLKGVTRTINQGLVPQSQLTHLAAASILEEGRAALPTLVDSTRLHLPLVQALLAHYQNHIGSAQTTVPIT